MPCTPRSASFRPLAVAAILVAIVAVSASVATIRASELAPPMPLSPADGAIMTQNNLLAECTVFGVGWEFHWAPVGGAAVYQLAITRDGESLEVYPDVYTGGSSAWIGKCGCFDQSMLSGWAWRVRAQSHAGRWGSWSEPASFSVERFPACMQLHVEQ